MCTVKKPTFLLAVLLLVAALCLADTTHEGNWSNPFCYRNVFNQSDHIAEVERVTLQRVTPEFVTSRMHRGQPYIVSGVTKGWPANHKWSHDYFERLFSGHELFSSTFSTPTSPDFSDSISAHETYYGIFLNSRDSARLVSTDYSYPSFIPPEWRITGTVLAPVPCVCVCVWGGGGGRSSYSAPEDSYIYKKDWRLDMHYSMSMLTTGGKSPGNGCLGIQK